jgi:ribosome-interacting GTPase 1
VIGVSVLDESSLEVFRDEVWRLTGLLRVFTRRPGSREADPRAVRAGATVGDVAGSLHHDLVESFVGARVWGTSVQFPGQRVGRTHRLADGDVVEIIT